MSHSIHEIRRRKPMWVYEKNYAFLLGLLPELTETAHDEFVLTCGDSQLEVTVLERCRYTMLIGLRQAFSLQAFPKSNSFLRKLEMKVRIYNDAKVAEVIAYQGVHRLQARYEYPNNKMLHRDEKRQANVLLHDWLSSVQAAGFHKEQASICSG